MAEHSPGPWAIDEHGHVIDTNGRTIADFDAAGIDQPTRDANKRLAVASPGLLAALQVAYEALGECHGFHQSTTATTIRAAIAKAEG